MSSRFFNGQPRPLENRGLPRIVRQHLAPFGRVAQILIRLNQGHHSLSKRVGYRIPSAQGPEITRHAAGLHPITCADSTPPARTQQPQRAPAHGLSQPLTASTKFCFAGSVTQPTAKRPCLFRIFVGRVTSRGVWCSARKTPRLRRLRTRPILKMRRASGKPRKPSADRKFPVRLAGNMVYQPRPVNRLGPRATIGAMKPWPKARTGGVLRQRQLTGLTGWTR